MDKISSENFIFYCNTFRDVLLKTIGIINYLNAFLWKVDIGRNSIFIGKSYFQRAPNTKISIGNRCRFLSRVNSNLIGINRPCSISTLPSHYNANIEIGNNCGFSGTVIGAFKFIKIGNNIRCGANTLITDADWHLDDYRSGEPADVIIED